MPSTYRSAKLGRPALRGAVPRPRLFRLLDAARKKRLIWVSGPPGSGKTTLVANYLTARRCGSVWYQVDASDADPASFFYSFGLATARLARRSRQPLPRLGPEHLAGLDAFSRRYFREFFDRLGRRRLVLVFDDVQEVPADAPWYRILRECLAVMPADCGAVVISRTEPVADFARLRANGEMVTIGWPVLQFTVAESLALVRRHGHTHRTGRDLKQLARSLHENTQGWAAGLMLMLEGAESRSAAADERLLPETTQTLFDYFAAEVFGRLSRDVQRFMLAGAFLASMTPETMDAVTGRRDSRSLLATLRARNCFIGLHAGVAPVYRYHPLFREFLLTRAAQALGPEERQRIKRAAAAQLADSGLAAQAVPLWQELGAWDDLARLITREAAALVEQGRYQTLQSWLAALPAGKLARSPWLLYWQGVAWLPFEPPRARAAFEAALRAFESAQDGVGVYLAWSGIVDSFFYEWNDVAPLDRWIESFHALQARGIRFPSEALAARSACSLFSALMFRAPSHRELPKWEARVYRLLLESEDPNQRIRIGHHLLIYYTWWIGDLSRATLVMNTIRPLVKPERIAPLAFITWCTMEAAYHWFTASYESCLRAVETGLQTAEATGVHVFDFLLLIQGVFGALINNDTEQARVFLVRAAETLGPGRRLDTATYHYAAAIVALAHRDPLAALAHAQAAVALADETGAPFARAAYRIALSQALFECGGRLREALRHLAAARRLGRAMRSLNIEFGCLFTAALFALERGRQAAAVRLLRHSLAIARQHRYAHRPLWTRHVMTRLFTFALGHGIEVEYVQDLIRRRGLALDDPPVELENWPWPLRVFTLGRFAVVRESQAGRPNAAQARPLRLLQALIALGGRAVAQEKLADALWPEAPGDAAHHAFETTLYRLRKMLGQQAVELREGCLSLNPRYCWVDVWALERLLAEAQALPRNAASHEIERLSQEIFRLYTGSFLPELAHESWTVSLRERLRSRFLRAVLAFGHYWEDTGIGERAVEVYRRGLEVEPLSEELYQRSMRCYRQLDRPAEALAVYQRCRETLARCLGVTPGAETEAIRASLRPGK